ncbi:hypothetical protein ACWC0C_46735 [Streptomyces sp. NPDC001709]
MRHDFDPTSMSHTLPWVEDLHGDAHAMRRLAASSHPLVRRSVARARHLPPDVVARLARDEDRVVRLFLAESCQDAPADMLLEVWRWWDGSFSHPDRPRSHPNFPRTGLLRYTTDPSGRMRCWPWTIRSQHRPTSHTSPGIPKPRCAAARLRTPGCHRPTRCGC